MAITVLGVKKSISINQAPPPLLRTGKLTPVGSPIAEAVQVFVGPNAYLNINSHTKSDLLHEVGGFLVGLPHNWEGHIYVEIADILIAEATSSGAVHLTFTPDTWKYAQLALQEKFPEMYVVGWYHTHPRMSVYMSAQDLAMHENFFREAWHLSLVIDPFQNEIAFFVWDKNQVRKAKGCHVAYPPNTRESEYWHAAF